MSATGGRRASGTSKDGRGADGAQRQAAGGVVMLTLLFKLPIIFGWLFVWIAKMLTSMFRRE